MTTREASDLRFQFGANWKDFLQTVDERQIALAIESFTQLLGISDFSGRTLLDSGIGCNEFVFVRA